MFNSLRCGWIVAIVEAGPWPLTPYQLGSVSLSGAYEGLAGLTRNRAALQGGTNRHGTRAARVRRLRPTREDPPSSARDARNVTLVLGFFD